MKQSDVFKLPDGSYSIPGANVYLIVRGGGRNRSWLFRCMISRRVFKKGLGSANAVTLATARNMGLRILSALAEGQTFQEATAFLSHGESPKKLPTWNDVAETAIRTAADVKLYKKNARTLDVKLYRNEKYIAPVLGNKALQDITVEDVLAVLKPHWKEGGSLEIASKCRAIMELVFRHARVVKLYTGPNPAVWKDNLDILLPPISRIRKVEHRNALTLDELRSAVGQMMANLQACKGNEREITKRCGMAAVVFGALTATRVIEFALARWSEIDLENAVWSVDPSHRKGIHEAPHRVPLSHQALELLAMLPAHDREDDFLFPGLTNAHVALGSPRLVLRKFSGKPTTMHGVRSTFRDWAEDELWHRSLSESALSHRIAQDATEAAYLRTDLLEKRRPMMQAWADALLPGRVRK